MLFQVTTLVLLAAALLALAVLPRWRFNLENPIAVYATVFTAYIVLPILLWSELDRPADSDRWGVLAAALLALFGTWLGAQLIERRKIQHGSPGGLAPMPLNAALIVGILLVLATVVHYAVLVSRGLINTHTTSIQPGQSVFDSLALVLTSQGKFAVIIFAGLAARNAKPETRRQIFKWLAVYLVLLVSLLTVTSETRPAATAIICGLIAWTTGSGRSVPLKVLLGGSLVIAVIVLVIQEVRRTDLAEIRNSETPVITAASSVWNGVLRTSDVTTSLSAADSAAARMLDGPRFSAILLNELEGRKRYLNGEAFLYSLSTMVPRITLPDKPAVVPLDVHIERELGLFETDRCVTSVSYFYAEYGWVGVFAGHLLIGALLAWVTKKALERTNVMYLLGCSFLWEVALQMELELPMEGLSALRLILFYGAVLWGINSLLPLFSGLRPRNARLGMRQPVRQWTSNNC